jgi:S-adenosylmethionine hydrolase
MSALVLQSDFGLDDGAVSAMYGVAVGVDPGLRIHDLTHNIPPYDIWEGSYRLAQVLTAWAPSVSPSWPAPAPGTTS